MKGASFQFFNQLFLIFSSRKLHSLFDQPGYMSVGKLCRIAYGFTRDGLDAKLIYLSGGWRRKYHAIFQSREKFKPEWIIFVHIEDTRDADGTPYCFICLSGLRSNRSLFLYSNRFGIFSLFRSFPIPPHSGFRSQTDVPR